MFFHCDLHKTCCMKTIAIQIECGQCFQYLQQYVFFMPYLYLLTFMLMSSVDIFFLPNAFTCFDIYIILYACKCASTLYSCNDGTLNVIPLCDVYWNSMCSVRHILLYIFVPHTYLYAFTYIWYMYMYLFTVVNARLSLSEMTKQSCTINYIDHGKGHWLNVRNLISSHRSKE